MLGNFRIFLDQNNTFHNRRDVANRFCNAHLLLQKNCNIFHGIEGLIIFFKWLKIALNYYSSNLKIAIMMAVDNRFLKRCATCSTGTLLWFKLIILECHLNNSILEILAFWNASHVCFLHRHLHLIEPEGFHPLEGSYSNTPVSKRQSASTTKSLQFVFRNILRLLDIDLLTEEEEYRWRLKLILLFRYKSSDWHLLDRTLRVWWTVSRIKVAKCSKSGTKLQSKT